MPAVSAPGHTEVCEPGGSAAMANCHALSACLAGLCLHPHAVAAAVHPRHLTLAPLAPLHTYPQHWLWRRLHAHTTLPPPPDDSARPTDDSPWPRTWAVSACVPAAASASVCPSDGPTCHLAGAPWRFTAFPSALRQGIPLGGDATMAGDHAMLQ